MLLTVLDSILLFAFAIPIVMKYRILPVEGTPYWLFGILFFLLVANCVVSFYPEILGKFRKHLGNMKIAFMVATIGIVLGGSMWTSIVDRAKTAPALGVHDIILQQEAAMRYLIVGKNPYKETYFGTPVESFHYGELGKDAVNPALFHFVMPPWYVVFPFVFYYPATHLLGFFDGRMALIFAMGMLLVSLWYWYRDKAIARTAIILSALSPSVVDYFIEGRSDIFALSWLMASLVLLRYRRYMWSGVMLALAILSKQTIWFIVPFYTVYVWLKVPHKKVFWQAGFISIMIGIAFVLPFLVWDTKAFVDSVLLYLTGNTPNSYPISGYGLGMLLYDAGIIPDIHAYYPFIIWQVAISLPLLILLLRWIFKKPTEATLVVSYAIFLTVYWYLSRYFNNSHLGYLSMVFVLGGLKHVDEGNT